MGFEEGRVLVVGCGGIGCELLKLLSKEDIRSITMIDCDTIDLSNLNRQFFFTRDDIGKSKAVVAAKIFKRLREDCDVFPICADILEFDARFFAEYCVVYNCLDNVEARSHVNRRCFISKTLLVDGGSGGFKGQAYYFDYQSECFDCIPKRVSREHMVCTIRSRPAKFEHCIIWARNVFFEMKFEVSDENKEDYYRRYLRDIIENCTDMSREDELNEFRNSSEYGDRTARIVSLLGCSGLGSFDKDNKNVMEYIYNVAYIRGRCAGIEPMTFDQAVTVAGNIVPIIGATNSIVASLMVHALRNKCNYYSVDNRKIISRLEVCEKNPGCRTCSHDWYGVMYRDGLGFGDLSTCLRKSGLKLVIYSDDNRLLTADMEDVDEAVGFGYDTVGEAICTDATGRRVRVNLYFLSSGDKLYFGRIYGARP